ncbi:MAG: T9SS type A sorting domain-containing protein [Ignavibacteriae bacterium]|nr:T9SS type A sorting domain-containing protein [Ignavibacteriota bacterium]
MRLRPVPASFTSTPPITATQDIPYTYKPTLAGTPPWISLASCPEGMMIDTTTWTITWTPTNDQALQGQHLVVLRAENGAGSVNQILTVDVANVNDPPQTFSLRAPANDSAFVFTNQSPAVAFDWNPSHDPDLDTVRYVVEMDTVETFNSGARREMFAGSDASFRVELPRASAAYYWRVRATDGIDSLFSSQTWRFSVTYLTAIVESKPKAKPQVEEAVLEQNFPNPFNPSTTITYTIPKGGFVRLSVFNLLGQEVAHVFSGVQSAGTFEVQFNKEELPTGIYFYRIQAPGFAETRKMVITK